MKVVLKISNSVLSTRGILLKKYYEIKHFQVYTLQSVPAVCGRNRWTELSVSRLA